MRNLSITAANALSRENADLRNLFSLGMTPGSAKTGYNSASGLESLTYIFTNIEICESVSPRSGQPLTAFGYGDTENCSQLFSNSKAQGAIENNTVDELLAMFNDPNDTFDLMKSADLERLNANSSSAGARDYNYMLVNWAPAIGVKGTVSVDGTNYMTKAPASYSTNSGGQTITNVNPINTGSAEMTYVKSPNGGMVTKFATPISVEGGKNYALDIILNPVGVLKGCEGSSGNISDGTRSLDLPMLPVTAVLRETSDTLVRESYTFLITGSASDGVTYRMDLYHLKSDAEKTPLAATLTGLANNSSADCYMNTENRIMRVEKQADGTYSFYSSSNDSSTLITGFQREVTTGNTAMWRPNSDSDGMNYGVLGLPSTVTTTTNFAPASYTTTEL